MHEAISNYDYKELDDIVEKFLFVENNLVQRESNSNKQLDNLIFVITGKLKSFKNRDELKALIELHGGNVAGSVSKNTNYLINNDNTSNSAKNVSAQKLGIPVITEEEFIKIFDF